MAQRLPGVAGVWSAVHGRHGLFHGHDGRHGPRAQHVLRAARPVAGEPHHVPIGHPCAGR